MVNHDDAFDDNPDKQVFVIKDERAALRIKREETREARAKFAAIVARERVAARAAERLRKAEIRLELTKLKLGQSASQKARTVLAQASPWMVCFILGGYVAFLSSGEMDASTTATSSALITLVMTGLLSNLRSIISEGDVTESSNGNGNGDGDGDKPKTDSPKAKSKP